MRRKIPEFKKKGIDVTNYYNANPADKSSLNFARFLKPDDNRVTVFQDNDDVKQNLMLLCNKYVKDYSGIRLYRKNDKKINIYSRIIYFSYAGVSSESDYISIRLGPPIDIYRKTQSGVVFGIKNNDFNLLTFNADHKSKLANIYNKNFEKITTYELLKYVCANFSMNDLLVSMRGKKVISHLIFSIKGQKLNLKPNIMGLTDKFMTDDQLKTNTLNYLNKRYDSNREIPYNFQTLFEQIKGLASTKTPQSTIIYNLSLDYISSLNSEIFEIFSAYDLLNRQGFQNYKVFFPKSQTTSLYDYELIPRSNSYDSTILVSVKNNISVNKIELENMTDKFQDKEIKGNTLKPSSAFNNESELRKWRIWTHKNRNNNNLVYTSPNNNVRVYRIFSPAVITKSSTYTIEAIKNLGLSNNQSTGWIYIDKYLQNNNYKTRNTRQQFINDFLIILGNINKNSAKSEVITISTSTSAKTSANFIKKIKKLSNVKNSVNNITVLDIQIICEKILEYNSKNPKTDLKASNQNDNTNFVDIASYLVNRNSRRVIFSSAKHISIKKNQNNNQTLNIYFQHVMVNSEPIFNKTWIPLRSQAIGSSLGMDLSFYKEKITNIPIP